MMNKSLAHDSTGRKATVRPHERAVSDAGHHSALRSRAARRRCTVWRREATHLDVPQQEENRLQRERRQTSRERDAARFVQAGVWIGIVVEIWIIVPFTKTFSGVEAPSR